MNGIFSADSPFFRFCSWLADVFMLNLIFVITCIPIITIGASLSALNVISIQMIKKQEGYIIRGFLKEFRKHFKKSTILWLLMLFVGVVLGIDFYFWNQIDNMLGMIMKIVTVSLLVIFVSVSIYIFPVVTHDNGGIKTTIKTAALLCLYRLPITVLLICLYGIISYFMMQFVIADIFMLVFGFGLLSMASAVLYRLAFRKINMN